MTPFSFTLVTFGISVLAGVLGSLLGLGGGIIVIPALTLLLGVHIRYAAGASIVSVIATSSAAAATYVRERMSNLRLALVLELATTSGAITGAFVGGLIKGRWLYVIFGVTLAYSALAMLRGTGKADLTQIPPDPLADQLNLHGSYFDPALNRNVDYRVTRTRLGFVLMYIAGIVSGLLGIGSGALKVPALDLAMRIPMKASTATSNFMMGVTAAASAGVYFSRGDIDPLVAAPVAAGVLIGATMGGRLLGRLHSHWVRVAFVIALVVVSLQMLYKGIW